MSDIDRFRAETRAWLEANCPAPMRTPITSAEMLWSGSRNVFVSEDQRLWFERMRDKGWTVVQAEECWHKSLTPLMQIIRDKIGTTEQRFHGQMRGSKDAVRGQYGDDSNELAAMGLKKASEKKRGSGKSKPAEE